MLIIEYLAHGMPVKIIANKMDISVRTIETQLEQFCKRTESFSKLEIIKAYWRKNKYECNF